MNKENTEFISNECLQAITTLCKKYHNDMTLGSKVRDFISDIHSDIHGNMYVRPVTKQIKIDFNGPIDHGDVNEN